MSDEQAFMRLALEEAARAARAGEVPVGAVLVHQGQVIARGHNQTLALKDITAHAEIQALRQASLLRGNHRLDDCELYVTLEPCVMCSGALMGARLRRVVWGAAEPKTGAAGSVLDVFADKRLNPHTEVHGGVLAGECAQVLQAFFQHKRSEQALERSATRLRDDALRLPEALQPNWPDGVRSQFVSHLSALDGHRLHVLSAGPASEAAVVALHGPSQWSAAFTPAAERLAKAGQAVFAPDLLGFGLSDKPKKANWHTLDRHAAVLREWMAGLPQRRLWLVAPPAMGALLERLRQDADLSARLRCHAIDEPELGRELQALPYPDAGHRAALRAMPALLGPASALPAPDLLGPGWPDQLLSLILAKP